MRTDDSLAAVVPYGYFTPKGEVYLRGRGLMAGYELHGLSLEASTKADLAAAADRLVEALRHLGTNDMVQAIFHRLPATAYPERHFPSRAASLIDEERRRQFEAENYWRTLSRLYITTQIEAAVPSPYSLGVCFRAGRLESERRSKSCSASASAAPRPFRMHWAERSIYAASTKETFRDLILAVTGRDFPAIMPAGKVRLNEIIASERWYGGVAPWIGELHLRPVCITAYPAATHAANAGCAVAQSRAADGLGALHLPGPGRYAEQLKLERIFWVRGASSEASRYHCAGAECRAAQDPQSGRRAPDGRSR